MLVVDDILTCAAGSAPDAVALTLGDEALTFSQLRDRSYRLANALHGHGVSGGDRIAYWADTSLGAAPLQFALGRLGAVFAPLNPSYSDEEAQRALEYLNPRLLVADAGHGDRAEALASKLDVDLAASGSVGPGAGLDALADAASPSSPPVPPPSEEAVFAIFLTSGSTGAPKGVMVSQRATWLRAYAGSLATSTTGGAGQLVTFPLFHMAGWAFAYYAWSAHQPAHLVAGAEGDEILAAIERHRPGCLYCIPAVWHRVLGEPAVRDVDSLEWALVGTSRVDTELLTGIKERFPRTATTVSYGSTEICRALSLADRDLFRKPGSVGLPVPGVSAHIAGDGELLLRSSTLMSGYHDLPVETAAALRGGWYHTGDLVERDSEGYFHVVGRTKEIIRTGGEWVAPIEVEAAVSSYPGVADVAVIGVPDSRWGEIVCAAVVMTGGAPIPTVEDLRQHLDGRIASYKHPRRLVPMDRLPRTEATGQIRRSFLARREPAT